MKFTFNTKELSSAFSLVKLVRPVTNDYILSFSGKSMKLSSYDKRKVASATIESSYSDVEDDFVSDDFYLPFEKQSVLESKLEETDFIINSKGLSIKHSSGSQTRQANIASRTKNAGRPSFLDKTIPSDLHSINPKVFEECMRLVSCSALVKDTKTDEDMKINQVHFYSDLKCVYSNARTYSSLVFSDSIDLDISIISSDIPIIRSFCSQHKDKPVKIGFDNKHLYFTSQENKVYLSFTQITGKKLPIQKISDEFEVEISISKEIFNESMNWSNVAIDATGRLSMLYDDGNLIFSANGSVLSSFPCTLRKGKEFKADFPIKIISNFSTYTTGKTLLMKYCHKSEPSLLEFTSDDDSNIISKHYVRSMKSK